MYVFTSVVNTKLPAFERLFSIFFLFSAPFGPVTICRREGGGIEGFLVEIAWFSGGMERGLVIANIV